MGRTSVRPNAQSESTGASTAHADATGVRPFMRYAPHEMIDACSLEIRQSAAATRRRSVCQRALEKAQKPRVGKVRDGQ
jgi:hypothetical protein